MEKELNRAGVEVGEIAGRSRSRFVIEKPW